MEKGTRVEVIDGSMQGSKATVTGDHEDDGFVWITFDRKGKSPRFDDQWFEISRLRVIE